MVRTLDIPRADEPSPPRDAALLALPAAAEILNVDQVYLVRLLDAGIIPAAGTGERRVRRGDLLAYKRERDDARQRGLDRLLDESLAAGLDDVDYDAIADPA